MEQEGGGMSAWWLVLIIPISVAAGVVLAAMLAAGKEADRISEAMAIRPPEPVTVKVTRYIPQDLWMEKILEKDVKAANTWLAISMGQMLGPSWRRTPRSGPCTGRTRRTTR